MGKVLKRLKKVRLRSLVILIILLLFNTYAWFVFIAKVNTSINVHVGSWSILFKTKDQVISNHLTIDINKAQPGMDDFVQTINVINNGDSEAYLTCEITSLKIFGITYTVSENDATLTELQKEKLREGYPLSEGNYSENQIKEMIQYYPFDISIDIGDFSDVDGVNQATYTISMIWNYETGNDELDTFWGEAAYEFYDANPDTTNSIELGLMLEAKQKDTSTANTNTDT